MANAYIDLFSLPPEIFIAQYSKQTSNSMSKFSYNFSQLNWSTFTSNRLKFTVDSFNDSQMKNISEFIAATKQFVEVVPLSIISFQCTFWMIYVLSKLYQVNIGLMKWQRSEQNVSNFDFHVGTYSTHCQSWSTKHFFFPLHISLRSQERESS